MNLVPPIYVDTAAYANGTLPSGPTAEIGNGYQRTDSCEASGIARPAAADSKRAMREELQSIVRC